jgi:hypothetical protein
MMKTVQRKTKNNPKRTSNFQTVGGNAACATITTLKVELNASDVKKLETIKTITVSQNISDKWKTRSKRHSKLDKMVLLNQNQNTLFILTTEWLKSMV